MLKKRPELLILLVAVVGIGILYFSSIIKPVSYKDVGKYVGQTKRVDLQVAKTSGGLGEAVTLYSTLNDSDFKLIIPKSKLTSFPKNPELYYRGKHLRVNGLIEHIGSAYQMTLNNKSQIEEVRK